MLLRRYKQSLEVKEEAVEAASSTVQTETELTVKEIKEQLDAKGIEYKPRAKKEELLELLK